MVLICKISSPLHQRMFFAKSRCNWPSGSGEEHFLISSMYFRYFVIISPWKRAWPFICTNLNAPLPKDALYQVWLKLTHWFLRRRFLNFVNEFSQFCYYLTLKNSEALQLNRLNPLYQKCFVQSLVEIGV